MNNEIKGNGTFSTESRVEESDFKKIRHLFVAHGVGISGMVLYFKGKYTEQQIKTALKEILLSYGN